MSSQLNVPAAASANGVALDRGPDLPRDYHVTRLVLLPRDPQWIFAYWEIAPATWNEVEKAFGAQARQEGRAVLRLSARRAGENRTFDVGVDLAARNWYVATPVRGGVWVGELGLVLPDGRFVRLAVSNEIHMPNGEVSNVIDERWGQLSGSWKEFFELSGGGKLGASSMELTRLLGQRWEFLKSGSSWTGSAVTSWRGPKGKNFWLTADCELIVYGATEPDAKVTVQGKRIPLNADGTFTLRFSLPDGLLPIPIRATNADGDLHEGVDIDVTRQTRKR